VQPLEGVQGSVARQPGGREQHVDLGLAGDRQRAQQHLLGAVRTSEPHPELSLYAGRQRQFRAGLQAPAEKENDMSPLSRAGAACLILGPIAGVASVLIQRSVSLQAADLAVAYTAHPTATHLGFAVNAVASVLTAAGLIWFAWSTYSRSPRLAVAGGVLGGLGLFSVMFDDAVHLAGSIVTGGLTPAQATPLLDRLTSGGVTAAGIFSELADLGVILLAVAALRLGVPRWGSALICIGALAQGLGFASGTRYLAAAGFAVALVGFATVVRTAFERVPANPLPLAAQRV